MTLCINTAYNERVEAPSSSLENLNGTLPFVQLIFIPFLFTWFAECKASSLFADPPSKSSFRSSIILGLLILYFLTDIPNLNKGEKGRRQLSVLVYCSQPASKACSHHHQKFLILLFYSLHFHIGLLRLH